MYKVLIGGPIKQKFNILKEFIMAIKELDLSNLDIRYIFIDDNIDEKSSNLLKDWSEENYNIEIVKLKSNEEEYICDEFTHKWTNTLVNRVGEFKNYIINKAKEYNIR